MIFCLHQTRLRSFRNRCIALTIPELMILAIVASMDTSGIQAKDTQIKFNRDIRPLLSDRCFHCHGPDEEDRKAGLRLDQRGGEQGALSMLSPGDANASELYRRITSSDPDVVMPPPEAHKKPLSMSEKKKFRQWIDEGAQYETFWAFTTLESPPTPTLTDDQWSTSDIDRFVKRKLDDNGLASQRRADRRTLIRRLSLDLTGLPPSSNEITEFLSDTSTDAYEKVVDRLLKSPRFGEHIARHWLDLVRFADTNGIHHDHYRDLSPYRDWVIRAFNENLPYDDFVRFQLAGDLYETPSEDQLVASGFNRLHMIIDRGTMLPEESHARNVIDRVTSVGTAFMGLTVDAPSATTTNTTQSLHASFTSFTLSSITLMPLPKQAGVLETTSNGASAALHRTAKSEQQSTRKPADADLATGQTDHGVEIEKSRRPSHARSAERPRSAENQGT